MDFQPPTVLGRTPNRPLSGESIRPRTGLAAGRLLLLALALGSLAAPHAARATILTFDESRNGDQVEPTGSGSDLGSDYGDNVSGASMAVPGGVYTYGEAGEGFTPDVTVDIRSSLDSPTDPGVRLWQQGYGDLLNVVFSEGPGTAGAPLLFVRLTAAPGFVVDLYDFDLAHFSPVPTTIAGVSVLEGDTTLFSAADVLVAGSTSTPGRTTFSFPTPLSAIELLLRIDVSNLSPGAQDNIGLDNLRFGQTPPRVVPEPGTALLVFLGLAGLAARKPWSFARVGARS
jgi:hypothetical protein